jgi:hypothetical protein
VRINPCCSRITWLPVNYYYFVTEVQTFQQYVAEKKAAPASKAALLDYYQRWAEAASPRAQVEAINAY